MLKLYAAWGLDFIKVDCISDRPYRPTEIGQIAEAIRKTGRPIVLSLSPGPTATGKRGSWWPNMRRCGASPTTTGTDGRLSTSRATGSIPSACGTRSTGWPSGPYVGPGNWPDEDMLPWGWLGPHPGWGEPRQSRLTHDEQRTEFTLWAIARSPLILGANLTKLDDFTRSLITNQTHAVHEPERDVQPSGRTAGLPAGFENARVWRATINAPGARGYAEYFAFFNLDDKPVDTARHVEGTGPGQRETCGRRCVDDGDRQALEGRERNAARARQHGDRSAVRQMEICGFTGLKPRSLRRAQDGSRASGDALKRFPDEKR